MKKIEKVIIIILILGVIIAVCAFYKSNNKLVRNIVISENSSSNEKKDDVVKKDNLTLTKKLPITYNASVPIFMYHWIREDTGDYMYPENMVKPDYLEEQIKYLIDNKFDFIYISDLENIYEFNKPVALTFDDGWLDVYLYMFPLAKKYNVKFSMYVITGEIGNNGYCTKEQLIEMKKSGLVDIQSHTVTHPYLADLGYEEQKKELIESKKYLKEELGIDSKVICYPYGSRNENTVYLSEESEYKYGLDMDGGICYYNANTNMYKIPRIYVNRSMEIGTFADNANLSNVDVTWEE